MVFNVEWNRNGSSFVREFAAIGPTRFPTLSAHKNQYNHTADSFLSAF